MGQPNRRARPAALAVAAERRGTGSLTALMCALAAGVALYLPCLQLDLVGDDFSFLRNALAHPLLGWLGTTGGLPYYRPLSRQVWAEVMLATAGSHGSAYHALNLALLLAGTWLLALTCSRLGHRRAAPYVVLAVLAQHSCTVLVGWASCAQDLLAFVGIAAAIWLTSIERRGLAVLAVCVAFTSKESGCIAAFLCLTVEWTRTRDVGVSLRRTLPALLITALWMVSYVVWFRHFPTGTPGTIVVDIARTPGQAVRGVVHSLLAIVNSDDGFRLALNPTDWMRLLAGLAFTVAACVGGGGDASRTSSLRQLGAVWTLLALPLVASVGHQWTTFHSFILGAGLALLAGDALARRPRLAVIILPLLVVAGPLADAQSGGAHEESLHTYMSLTRLRRTSTFVAGLRDSLRRVHPSLRPYTHIYLSRVPAMALFSLNGASAVETWYRDPTLTMSFLDSTALTRRPGSFIALDYVPNDTGASTWREESQEFLALRLESERGIAAGSNDATLVQSERLIRMPEAAWLSEAWRAGVWLDIARMHLVAGRAATAESCYTTALSLDANDPTASQGLALAQLQRGNLAAALTTAETAARRVPDDSGTAYVLGLCLFRAGRYSEASSSLQSALSGGLDPSAAASAQAMLRWVATHPAAVR